MLQKGERIFGCDTIERLANEDCSASPTKSSGDILGTLLAGDPVQLSDDASVFRWERTAGLRSALGTDAPDFFLHAACHSGNAGSL